MGSTLELHGQVNTVERHGVYISAGALLDIIAIVGFYLPISSCVSFRLILEWVVLHRGRLWIKDEKTRAFIHFTCAINPSHTFLVVFALINLQLDERRQTLFPTTKMAPSPFACLPTEILESIFVFLDTKTLQSKATPL